MFQSHRGGSVECILGIVELW